MRLRGGDWSKGDVIALFGLFVAVVGVVAAILAIPGMPKIFHWDSSDEKKESVSPAPVQTALTPRAPQPAQKTADVSSGQVNFGHAQTEEPIARPTKINMCILHCFVLTLENGRYINVAPQNTSTYTVVSFTRESVILHRIDRGSFPLTADLTGRISSDGEHIHDGTIVWTSGNRGSGRFQASWGSHIGDTPESD